MATCWSPYAPLRRSEQPQMAFGKALPSGVAQNLKLFSGISQEHASTTAPLPFKVVDLPIVSFSSLTYACSKLSLQNVVAAMFVLLIMHSYFLI